MRPRLALIALLILVFSQANAQTIGNYSILILESNFGYSTNAQSQFQSMGHTATVISPSLLTSTYDYSPYDIVVFGFSSALPADLNHLLDENINCNVGIVIMRGDTTVDDLDMGASGFWNSGSFQIDNNTHWITAPFSTGPLPLSFAYKSAITSPTANTTTLGSVSGLASLLVHDTYRRVVMPYYGHGSGMPWNDDADTLTNRVLAWAASSPCCAQTTSNLTVSNCESYITPSGDTLSSPGIVTDTINNVAGCDSIITIDLTILDATSATDVITACDSYTWIDGNTYTSSNNTATDTLTNAVGCDSVVTLDLTINNSNTATEVITACDSYTWIDGNTYTSSNSTATFTLTNAVGCDSVVTLDLTIDEVSDITTATMGITIMANNANATYQWLDCDSNNALIPGDTGQSFTATANGSYAVELTENGCVDTSACVAITTVGILESNFESTLTVFPNPTNGEMSIDLGENYNDVTVIIRDQLGQDVLKKSFKGSGLLRLNIPGEAGMYSIEVSSGDKKAILNVVKT